jgi:hypothetical protein
MMNATATPIRVVTGTLVVMDGPPSDTDTRLSYVCTKCGAGNCKLWRIYQSEDPRLMCAPCSAEDQGRPIDGIDAKGQYVNTRLGHPLFGRTSDEIGWRIPACIAADGSGYHAIMNCPPEQWQWWYNLPTLPTKAKEGAT